MRTVLAVSLVLAAVLAPVAGHAQAPTSRVVFENESIRVTLLAFSPGGATGRHVGLEPEIGIAVEGELTLESPTGPQSLSAGSVYWMPGLTPHDLRNEGPGPARVWDIFLKRCD
jgi:quercetin dioxygenase-like cupin family protein